MIKRYRNKKLIELLASIIFLMGVYFFTDLSIVRIIILALTIFIGLAYNAKLLTKIELVDGFYIFETYSIITKKEKIKILESHLTNIIYKSESLLYSYNLILKFHGKNGMNNKKLYINAEPWSELTSDLCRIKKTIANNGYE